MGGKFRKKGAAGKPKPLKDVEAPKPMEEDEVEDAEAEEYEVKITFTFVCTHLSQSPCNLFACLLKV